MGGTYSTSVESRNASEVLIGKAKGRIALWIPCSKLANNIKTNLKNWAGKREYNAPSSE
jgi:hypothetical protein